MASTSADSVHVAVFVRCNCGKPVGNASVKAEVNNTSGRIDGTVNGATDDKGLFVGRYKRSGTLSIVNKHSGFVLACNKKTSWTDSPHVTIRLNFNNVMQNLWGVSAPSGNLPSLRDIESMAKRLWGYNSQSLLLWFCTKVVVVNCHNSCSGISAGHIHDEKDHKVVVPSAATVEPYEVGSSMVVRRNSWPIIGRFLAQDNIYIYSITNQSSNKNITDFKLCFDGKIPSLKHVGPPTGWTHKISGDCLVFETSGPGIPLHHSKYFAITCNSAKAKQGVVQTNVSYNSPTGHVDGHKPTSSIGPVAMNFDLGDNITRRTILLTGDVPKNFSETLTMFLNTSGFSTSIMKNSDSNETIISTHGYEQDESDPEVSYHDDDEIQEV